MTKRTGEIYLEVSMSCVQRDRLDMGGQNENRRAKGKHTMVAVRRKVDEEARRGTGGERQVAGSDRRHVWEEV